MYRAIIQVGLCLAATGHLALAQDRAARFGDELDADENRVVVGSQGAERQRGRIDVFARRGRNWSHAGELAAPDAQTKFWGASFRLDGNNLVVGNPRVGTGTGAAHVYALTPAGRIGGRGVTLSAADGQAFHQFGLSLAIDSDVLAVGAPSALFPGAAGGAVYVFAKQRTGWGAIQKLSPPYDADEAIGFGQGLAVDPRLLAVGAPRHQTSDGRACGAVYLYARGADNAYQLVGPRQLDMSQPGVEAFGQQLVTSPRLLVVAATLEDVASRNDDQGAVYVFSRDRMGQAGNGPPMRLVAPDGGAKDMFGSALALSDSLLCIGSSQHDTNGVSNAGAAYVYRLSEDGTVPQTPTQILTAPVPSEQDLFGYAIAISGTTVVIGAAVADGGAGAVYLFDLANDLYAASFRISPSQGIVPLTTPRRRAR